MVITFTQVVLTAGERFPHSLAGQMCLTIEAAHSFFPSIRLNKIVKLADAGPPFAPRVTTSFARAP